MQLVSRILRVALFGATILATFPLGGVTAIADTETRVTAAADTADADCYEHRHAEKGFFRKINNARARSNTPPVHLDRELSRVARRHTWEMATRNLLHHTTANDFRSRVTNWQLLGENVGVGDTVDTLHAAFMDSPAHRANILKGGYRNVGIGTLSAKGRLWVTVVFEERTDPGTTLPMPSC